ncbi:DUF7224 domain-containing protein [Streptomyces shenzhenensis]|uniref:DUF7224 domain-containing protein n=1 Tax=Streptomyces shenzhenensis TaxID=943815 RepID=UPI003F53E6E7
MTDRRREPTSSLVAQSALPQDVPACATSGEWPGSAASGPLTVWLTRTAGVNSQAIASRYMPEEVAVATRVLERPRQAQLAWFQRNARTLTRCDLKPVLDPARF